MGSQVWEMAVSVPLSDRNSKRGAHVDFIIAAFFSFRDCSVGLCSVGPFWDKNCEMDSRGVLGQERTEGPLIKAPEDAEQALERLCLGTDFAQAELGQMESRCILGLKPEFSVVPLRPSEKTAQPQPPWDLEKRR